MMILPNKHRLIAKCLFYYEDCQVVKLVQEMFFICIQDFWKEPLNQVRVQVKEVWLLQQQLSSKLAQQISPIEHLFRKWARLLSSEFFHWTRPDLDTCPRVDTCPRSNVSSEKIHWTQAWPFENNIKNAYIKSKLVHN